MIEEETTNKNHLEIFRKLRSYGYKVLSGKKRINHFTAVIVRPDTLESAVVQIKQSTTNAFIVGDGYESFMNDTRFDNLIYILIKIHKDNTHDVCVVPGKIAKKIRKRAWEIHPQNNPGSEGQKTDRKCRQTLNIKEIYKYKDDYFRLWK